VGDTGEQDDEDETAVPGLGLAGGFGAGGGGSGAIPGLSWWDKEDEGEGSSRPSGGQTDAAEDDYIPGLGAYATNTTSSAGRQYGRSTHSSSSGHQDMTNGEGERDEFGRDRGSGGDDEWRRSSRGGGHGSGGYGSGAGYNRSARYGPQRRGRY